MLKSSFINLFKKASLNNKELEYFMEDIEDVINNMEDINNAEEYYNLKETQYCCIEYAEKEWKEIAKSGLEKILNVI